MTVPKSKVLSVSKGLMALADFKHCSPDVKQSVIVNVSSTKNEKESGVNTDTSCPQGFARTENEMALSGTSGSGSFGSSADRVLKTRDVEDLEGITIVQPSIPKEGEVKYDNPYANINSGTVETLRALVTEKENVAKALSIMLDLVENNPLIINKLIIARSDVLAELIKLLASADEVKISYLMNEDVGCSCGSTKFIPVDKIYVVRNGETKILKYAYPDVIQILDQHRISYKMVMNEF